MTIAVICDRCRAAGTAGTGDFSHFGDLLEFEPVPRSNDRIDGWNEDNQRAFIAMLATTGSPHRAAKALGKAPKGATRLREAEGSGSFNAAWDRALAIAARNGTLKISKAVAEAAARSAEPLAKSSRLRGFEPEPEPEMSDDDKLQLIERLFYKWLGKVEQEREARVVGEVVAADFYLRQVTFFEITFDLMCEGLVEDAWSIMSGLRRGGEHITRIAATPMSQILDAKRRELWEKMGKPDRPEYPPARYLLSKLNYSVASEHQALSEEDKQLPPRDQERLFKAMQEEEAQRQAEWESRAQSRREHDEHGSGFEEAS
jgi:hypothetical protein